jgi:cell division protein FtsA
MPPAPVVALEIGTSKIVALVGEMRGDGHVVIAGMGEQASAGVRKGEVVDLDHVQTCVRHALAQAEESGRVAIHPVHLALSGGHIETLVNRGTVPVLDPQAGVTEEDVREVTEVARAVNLSQDRLALHSVGQIFYVDGERVGRPEGFEGATLALDMLVVHAKATHVRNTVRLLRTLGMDVSDVAFSGLCSGLAVLSPEQKDAGALVVDLGGGVTVYAAYAASMFAATGALAVGGDHVTNDLMVAFGTSRQTAERLKQEHGSALVEDASGRDRIPLPAEIGYAAGRSVSRHALETVIHLRMAETFGLIRRRLESAGFLDQLGAGVVLTGGGAAMRGAVDLAARVFGLPCTVGRPAGVSGLAAVLEGPQYATAAGLVRYAFKNTVARRRKGPWWKRLVGAA